MIINPSPGGFWVSHTCSISGHIKTAAGVPVANIAVEVIGAAIAGGNPVFVVYTDASGAYSIGSLPSDTYSIFPDSLNYITTPFSNVVVDSANPIAVNIDLTQYTTSPKIITPNTEAVRNVTTASANLLAYPSPTNGNLWVQWNEKATEKGTLSVSDITGREIYRSTIIMNEGNGHTQLNLSALTNGMYMINVRTATVNYNDKIEVQH